MSKSKKRFWTSLILGLPIIYMVMGKMLGPPMPEMSMMIQVSLQLFFSTLVIIANWSLWLSGIKGLIKLRPNMDALIFLGTAAAYFYSLINAIKLFTGTDLTMENFYFESAIFILVFISLGKYLEAITKGKTSEAIKKLIGMQPKYATVLRQIPKSKLQITNKSQIPIIKYQNEFYEEIKIPIEQVIVGDIIILKPGQQVPTDGVVIEGYSAIDEQVITGESLPVEKKVGDTIIGATMNKTGSLKFRVTKVGSDTMLAQIIKIVEEAMGSKAPIQELADKVAFYFVPIVITIAMIALITWLLFGFSVNFSISILVAMLIIACPCALGLATPTAIMMGTGLAANRGILIKNGRALENAQKIQVAVFDKTGTLTEGKPTVTDILSVTEIPNIKLQISNKLQITNPKKITKLTNQPASQQSSQGGQINLLTICASLEKLSEHPLAEAIVNKTSEEKITLKEVTDFDAIPGHGVTGKIDNVTYYFGNKKLMTDQKVEVKKEISDQVGALENQGKTVMYLSCLRATNYKLQALVAVSDTLKETSKQAISQLKKMGLDIYMITGDNERTAKAIAKQVGIDNVLAEILPENKAAAVKQLQSGSAIENLINENSMKIENLKLKISPKCVAFIGDGINDAPALAQADLGIALGSGTDVAIETGDIVLIKNNLQDVVSAIKISSYTNKKIKQNLFWAFFYNIISIPVAAGVLYPTFGFLLSPSIAALAMAFSSVSVVINSLLMKRFRD